MRNNGRNVRTTSGLIPRETGFSWLPAHARHRCDLVAEGVAVEDGRRLYDLDNRRRAPAVLFQYTFAGEGRYQELPGGRPQPVRPGEALLLLFPSATRYWLPAGGRWEFIYFMLSGDLALDLAGELAARHGPLWRLPAVSPPVEILRALHCGVLEQRLPDEFEAAALGHRFLMELFRLKAAAPERPPPAVESALRTLEARCGDPALDVAGLAAAAHYSKFHFSRLFKTAVGRSPHAYLQDLRLRRALELLAATQLPVKRIAAEVGYRDPAYFCKEFRRRTGRTPLAVRKTGRPLRLDAIATAP